MEQQGEKNITVALVAHVDAGKTTLSEAMLYLSGARQTLGRVDHQNAFLDTHLLERQRGITIFSKQAGFTYDGARITLVDTPGHVDFSGEAERTLPILDCAVLVISSTDGIQAHTLTLWRLLQRYNVPVFLFINKTDLPGRSRSELMDQLQQRLDAGCIDFGLPQEELAEQVALCDEALLENYLSGGSVTPENIRQLIAHRRVFPCCFGSALKLTGVEEFLQTLSRYAPQPQYAREFSARVYKISRDPQGNRLTWVKLTGGSLAPRSILRYQALNGDIIEEKVVQLRQYSADKFTISQQLYAGALCAITGLSRTYAGQALGCEGGDSAPLLEPVMTYRICLPSGCDPAVALPKLRQLEEEDPLLRLHCSGQDIHLRVMGKIQLEILKSLIAQRFSLDVSFDCGRIAYKETIADTVEGVGHFEPLRHYAEVHLLLEPLPQGSGLVFDTRCPADVLDMQYQKLILSHLGEKTHLGVLTGSPITDMKITLLLGRAHLKHTEGGDFRQATYRAVRQGLMQAQSVLLEPWYDFVLTLPAPMVGRAITDVRAMHGQFDAPETQGELAVLKGILPASQVGDYPQQLAAYTGGIGQLQLSLRGYALCHNAQAVEEAMGYDPEADLENTPDSVFCAHGAGFTVKWDRVKEYMHLESALKEEKSPVVLRQNLRLDDKELEAIMQREFGDIKRPQYRQRDTAPAREQLTIAPPRQITLLVDGYNIIFAWDHLAQTAQHDLDAARRQLLDALSSYAGYKKCRTVVVFDGYKVKGNPGAKELFHNIQVVYTKENETADAYIEALVSRIGKNDAVRVATSDSLVQLSSLRSGVLRVSARELLEEVELARQEMKKLYEK